VSERNTAVVRRLVEEVMDAGRLDLLDELYVSSMTAAARRWITAFRQAFPNVRMTVVDLVAEDDKVAARFTCSATQQGEWQGLSTSGRRFERVDEVTSGSRKGASSAPGVWRTTSIGCASSASCRAPRHGADGSAVPE
jgi:SnoaL-like polyketide cyclase